MNRIAAVLALLVLTVGRGLGQSTPSTVAPSPLPRVENDIPYGDGGDQQKLDLYLPALKGFTTVVFTYGGGWRAGSRKGVAPIGAKLQGLGFGCALLSH